MSQVSDVACTVADLPLLQVILSSSSSAYNQVVLKTRRFATTMHGPDFIQQGVRCIII